MRGADRSPHSRVCCLLYVTDESENFHSVRAEVRGKLVLDRFADRLEAALVDVLHDFDAHFLELRQRLMLEFERDRRLLLADFIGRRLDPFFLLIGQAAPGFVTDEQSGIVCLMFGQ